MRLPLGLLARGEALMTLDWARRWMRTALICQLIMVVVLVLAAYGVIAPLARPVTTDFASFYAAGRLAIGHDPALVYDRAAHYLAEQAAIAPRIAYVHFFYPPTYLIICGLLARLPYIVAFLVFEVSTVSLCLLVACLIGGGGRRWIVPILSFSPLLWNVTLGQNACLTAGLFGLGTWLLEARRPILGGIVLGCLCYKPHTGLLIPVALAAGGQRRAFLGAAACVVCIGFLTLGVFGLEAWRSFLVAIERARHEFSAGEIVPFTTTASVYGAFRLLGIGQAVAHSFQYVTALLVVGVVVWSWRQPDDGSGVRHAVLIAATLLIMPVVLFYDLVMLVIAAAWMMRAVRASRPGEILGLGVVWFGGLTCFPLACATHLPVAAACNALMLCLAVRRQAFSSSRLPMSNSDRTGCSWRHRTIS